MPYTKSNRLVGLACEGGLIMGMVINDGDSAPEPPEKPKRTIRALLAWLVVACLVPAGAGGFLLLRHQFLTARAQLEATTISTARALVQVLDSELFRAMAVGQALATAGPCPCPDFSAFHLRSRYLLEMSDAGDIVVLSDKEGQQLVNTLRAYGEPLPRHGNLKVLERVIETGKPVISNMYLGGVLRTPVMSIDVPIVQDGNVLYDVSVGMRPERFNKILRMQGLPVDWVAGIFDPEGTLAGRVPSPEKFVGQKGTAEFIQKIKEAPEGAIETVSREGIPILSAWSRSPRTGWAVGIGIPRSVLETELRKSLLVLSIGIASLIAFALVWSWSVARRIAGSIQGLKAPSLALGAGRSVEIESSSIAEVAEVGEAIRRASELLTTRTAALEQANRSLTAQDAELREAHRLAKFGAWRWSAETGEMIASESVGTIFGCDFPPYQALKGTLLPDSSWALMNAAMQEVMRTGLTSSHELEATHSAGYPIWLDVRYEPLYGGDQKVVGVAGTFLDITERKQAELSLQSATESYVQRLEDEVAERTGELSAVNKELARLARTDALTQLANRAVADERLRLEFLRMKRTGIQYAVLYMDVDHFKHINDRHGHEAGDAVLQQVARILEQSIRDTDLIARYGGEEFLALLPDTETGAAVEVASKIRLAIAEEPFPTVGQVTVSIGVSAVEARDESENEAVARADKALYNAKKAGRNRVQAA